MVSFSKLRKYIHSNCKQYLVCRQQLLDNSPVRVGAVPSNDELEFREAPHRDTVTASRKLQQLALLFLQEVVTNLPEVSVQKSTHLKLHLSHIHIQ